MKKNGKQIIMAGMGVALMGAATANAATLDLTAAGSYGVINGAFFQQVSVQPAGTGVIEPFVRILDNDGFEHGYNTGANNPPLDTMSSWTRNLLLSDLTTASFGGTDYYTFLLDINETGNDPLVTLSALQIYMSDTPSLSTTNVSALGTLVYNLGAANNIELNYALASGSGESDLLAFIPTDLFNVTGAPYIYFYSAFGTPSDAEAGFEEWATVEGAQTPIPEPGTMLLLGAGFVGLALYGKRRRTA